MTTKDQEWVNFQDWDGYLVELGKELSYVDVGITAKNGAQKSPPTSEGKQSDITLAQLAAIQEFGVTIAVTPKMRGFLGATGLHLKADTKEIVIPSRPFMRGTFDEQENTLAKRADELERMILTGKISKRLALSELGQMHRQQIQKNMKTQGKYAANHPYTIRQKGSSNELIDTGRLRQAIDFEVG